MRDLAAILRFCLRLLRGRRLAVAAVALLTIVELAAALASPTVAGDVLDALARAQAPGGPLVLLGLIALGAAVVGLLNRVASAHLAEALGAALRRETLAGAWRRDAADIERSGAGDLVTRVLGDATALKGALGAGLQLAVDVLTVVAVAALLAHRSPSIALIAFLAAPLSLCVTRLFSPRIERASLALREAISAATASVQSWATRGTSAKLLALEAVAVTRFEPASARMAAHGVRVGIWGGLVGLTGGVIVGGTQVAMLAYGGALVSRGQLSLGALVAITQYASFLLVPAQRIVHLLTHDVPALRPLHQRVRELTDVGARPVGDERSRPVTLAVTDLAFQRGDLVLEVPHLTASRGELVAIRGPNGAGKTTLARLFAGAYHPTRGRWLATDDDGHTADLVTPLGVADLVPQTPVIFDGTLEDNATTFGDVDRARLDDTATQASFASVVARLPQGWETAIDGSCADTFSAGELAKLALVRALYRDRPALVLDEPSASLDAASAAALCRLLLALRAEHIVIVVTHDPELLAICDRHYTLVTRGDATVCVAGGSAPPPPLTTTTHLQSTVAPPPP